MSTAPRRSLDVFLGQNNTRLNALVTKFAGYLTPIDRAAITAWLSQFDSADWHLGLRLLESVDYYAPDRVLSGSIQLHRQATTMLQNSGKCYFAAFGPGPGKSGDEILYRYRLANHLTSSQVRSRFITLADLQRFADNPSARFIFVDDFVGSGNQAVETWRNIVGLTNPEHQCVLAVHAAFQEGVDYVHQETRLQVLSNRIMTEADKIFSSQNSTFTSYEKKRLLAYCRRAGEFPDGYRSMQSNIVFYHRSPNNCISILRSNNSRWRGLFVRNI